MKWLLISIALLTSFPARSADLSPVPCCAGISAAEEARVQALSGQIFVYEGCDGTVAECLSRPEASPARRMAGEVCRRVKAGASDEAITHALDLRARSMMPAPAATIDLAGVPMVGSPDAPVVLVEYACVRCPFCAKLTPELVHEIQQGSMQGKVQFYFKLFPIKGHEGSTETGLAAMVAQDQSRFWDFLLLAYQRFDDFSVQALPAWATDAGLTGYDAAMAAPALRDRLVASKKEGMANGVKSTPTFFISGRMWQGDVTLDMLLDVLAEEAERLEAGG